MSIAKKLAYMPKARNARRSIREEKEVQEQQQDLHQEHVSYTLDEERMLAQNVNEPIILDEKESESSMPAARTSEMNKSSSAMWLQMKMSPSKRNGNSRNNNSKQNGTQGASNFTKMNAAMTSHDSRYAAGSSSLPYKLPQKDHIGSALMKQDAKNSNDKAIVAVGGGTISRMKIKDLPFNRPKFAAKPNCLVRQCTQCQMLYSMSHACASERKTGPGSVICKNVAEMK